MTYHKSFEHIISAIDKLLCSTSVPSVGWSVIASWQKDIFKLSNSMSVLFVKFSFSN